MYNALLFMNTSALKLTLSICPPLIFVFFIISFFQLSKVFLKTVLILISVFVNNYFSGLKFSNYSADKQDLLFEGKGILCGPILPLFLTLRGKFNTI